jgi:hypothetical protein
MENANNPVVLLEEMKVVAGHGMNQTQEPSEQSDESTSKAEDTAIQNEEKRPEAQVETPKAEEGGDSKHNASTVINELGESRKKVLEKFIESAKKSGVVAEELKELISQDKSLEKTFKSKFGDDYDALMRGDLAKPKEELTSEEYSKLKRKATLEAKLEVFKEEDERIKSKQIEVSFKPKRKVISMEIFLNPIFDTEGIITEISLVAHDITEKKKAEKEIKREQKLIKEFEKKKKIKKKQETEKQKKLDNLKG